MNYIEESLAEIKGSIEAIFNKFKELENPDGKEILDNQDVIRLLNISSRTLQNYRKHGVIPYSKLEGKIYYRKSEILKLIETNRIESNNK